jgi:hypothetical protein
VPAVVHFVAEVMVACFVEHVAGNVWVVPELGFTASVPAVFLSGAEFEVVRIVEHQLVGTTDVVWDVPGLDLNTSVPAIIILRLMTEVGVACEMACVDEHAAVD